MTNLRSQFKATSIKSLRKTAEKDNAMLGVQSNEYLNLEDGRTMKIRIFPAHPEHENFYIARKCYWLPFPTDEGETRRGTVLDSITHGGTKMDLVQEYVKMAKKIYGDDTEKMEALTGTGLNSQSLNPQYSWLCYADEIKEDKALSAKIWEFKKMVRDGLNKLAFSEDDDEPIEVDPFTDPDEGLPVLVKYLKKPNKKKGENYYEVNFPKKPVARPLTDEELDAFAALKPLDEIIPKYGIKEFDKALKGLQQWDEDFGFDLFDDDHWLEKVEEVKAQYDADADDEDETPKKKTVKKSSKQEDDDEEETPKSKKTAAAKPAPEPEPEVDEDEEDELDEDSDDADDDGDEFDDMDRTQLKKYIKENSLEIVVKKSMSDDDIREAIREAVNSDDADSEDDDEDEENEEPAAKPKLTLDDIRNKLKNKK